MNIYNIETHAWHDISEDGKAYGKGDNISLNTIHNFDDAFGKFWAYFQQSALADNTIVIFTTDHAHYHEKPYVEIVDKPGSDYQKLFIDKVPLVIYDPTRSLPKTYDANLSNSIDFAPSLIHYMSLANHENAFLGNSIFNKNITNNGTSVASVTNEIHLIKHDKIHTILNTDNTNKDDFFNLKEFILHTKALEINNQLWDSKLNNKIKSRVNEFLKKQQ